MRFQTGIRIVTTGITKIAKNGIGIAGTAGIAKPHEIGTAGIGTAKKLESPLLIYFLGMVGMLARKEADICIHGLSLVYDRTKVICRIVVSVFYVRPSEFEV